MRIESPGRCSSYTAKTIRIVPIGAAEEIVNRLRSRGGTVWYLKATDEGSSFAGRHNRDRVLPRVRAVPAFGALKP